MKQTLLGGGLAVMLTLLLAACDTNLAGSRAPEEPAPLVGTLWVLDTFVEPGGRETGHGSTAVTLQLTGNARFEAREFRGNLTFGNYRTGLGDSLSIRPGGVTEVVEPEGSRLYEFSAVLPSIVSYEIEGDVLVLTASTGARLRFSAKDRSLAPLVGTLWALDALVEPGGRRTGHGLTDVTLLLGTLSRYDTAEPSVTSGSGRYEQADAGPGSIRFADMTTSDVASPQGSRYAEFIGVLTSGPLTWRVEADTLVMTNAQRKGLRLTRVPLPEPGKTGR